LTARAGDALSKGMFKKILIANRGEIALRVLWACKELGANTVAVYSEADADSLHVRFADEAVCIGPPRNIDSYLNIPAIISAAEITGADAIHPGYGFLSESAYLAEICEACNLKFIGPGPQAIRLMGDKSRAKKAMMKAGVPVVPGSNGVVEDEEKAVRIARDVGFPVILKASAGGGGRGMRIVRSAADLAQAFRAAQAEAQAAFGVPDVYIERYVEGPRHVEVQVMADSKGNVVHLGERECSIQRRHQKIIEESPSPVVGPRLRKRIGKTAVEAAAAVQYVNAGTIEFLLDQDGGFYFMEMNTRIQVEHGVTELVTGRDLVKEQIRVAAGEPLSFSQKEIRFEGHALECRINAEDPVTFVPSPGTIQHFYQPGGPGVRLDTFAHEGCDIPPYYDSLIGKLMTHGRDRAEAIARMRRCLDMTIVEGIKTNIALHRRILADPDFVEGRFDTRFMDRYLAPRKAATAS
jgi:acetyl-CoA carboxylase biotin carboxylase subunit